MKNILGFLERMFALAALVALLPLISIFWIWTAIETKSGGIYKQNRVGQHGRLFVIYKLKTMTDLPDGATDNCITTSKSSRITKSGRIMRRIKVDEIPQLWNVVIGRMSLVGPRPDVPGYADKLQGDDRLILELKPGITGPASIKYKNEEALLADVEDPEEYNREVIWPDKVKINLDYYHTHTPFGDLIILIKTLL